MRRTTSIALLVALLLAGGLLLRGSRQEAEARDPSSEQQAAPVEVSVATVAARQVPETLEVTGTVKASLTADVAPKVMGKVSEVLVREGQRVRRGQVLARLESEDLAAQVRQAEAGLTSARAALSQARTGSEIQHTQSGTRVEQARAALRQAEEQASLVREGSRRQQKAVADEGVRQAQAAKAQADEGVRQARASLAAAQAQLSLVREGARRQQRLQADAALRQAEASLRTAQATYDRFEPLARDGVISRQRFDEIALQLEVARSQYETAKEQASLVHEGARAQEVLQAQEAVRQAEAGLASAQQRAEQAASALRAAEAQRDLTYEGSRSQEVRQAEAQVSAAREALRLARASVGETRIKQEAVRMAAAQVAQAEASLLAARTQLAYATLRSPFDGTIIKRHADPGAMAMPGVPLITLVDSSAYRVEVIVPESRLGRIRLGDRSRVTIDALGRALEGRVTQIVPSADAGSRTFVVKIGLPGGPGLAPGLFARASLQVGSSRSLLVPPTAVWRRGSLTGVFTISKGVARMRLVTLGKEREGGLEVLSGLSAGDVVVAEGVDGLSDGTAVRTRGGKR